MNSSPRLTAAHSKALWVIVALAASMALPAQAYVNECVPVCGSSNATDCATAPSPAMGSCMANTNQSTCPGGIMHIYWNIRTLPWVMYQDPSTTMIQGDLAWSDVQTALQAAATTWTEAAGTDLKFQYNGPATNFDIGFNSAAGATNVNLVVFRQSSCQDTSVVPAGSACLMMGNCGDSFNCWGYGTPAPDSGGDIFALTTDTFDSDTGQIVRGDMEFNAVMQTDTTTNMQAPLNNWFTVDTTLGSDGGTNVCPTTFSSALTSTCVSADVQNVGTHEWGHFLGLGHTMVTTATMYPNAPFGQISKRILDPDDVAGVTALYPTGKPAAYCVPPQFDVTPPVSKSKGCAFSTTDNAGIAALLLAVFMRRRSFRAQRL